MTRDPESLPEKMFLLAFDSRRERLTAHRELGYALRAAALADLVLRGHLRDDAGKACVVKPVTRMDPVLRGIWEEIERAAPRSWRHWIAGRGDTFRATRDALAGAGVIGVEERRILGLFPGTRITLRQPVRQLADEVGRAIRGSQPVARVDPAVAALAALASACPVRTVTNNRERRRFEKRLAGLGGRIAPIPAVLRRVVATARSSYGGG